MLFEEQKYWCGTQSSYDLVLEASARATQLMAGSFYDDYEPDPIWEAQGTTAVVSVHGPLINGEAGFMSLFGVVGYGDIRAALAEAVADKNIKNILLDINSGGGQVSGVSDLAAFIRQVDSVKPVYTFSDGVIASAAYWLGTSARSITISDTTIAGSVGVLQVHSERSKQLEMDGVKATIVRSGKYKALANSIEPLSDLAKAEMQSQVDDMYQAFIAHVADMRGVPLAKADETMGQGREFLGKRALDAGLVDKVGNYDSVVLALTDKNSKPVAKGRGATASIDHNPGNPSQGHVMKVVLTAEQIAAAVAAGANADAFELAEPTAEQKAQAEAAKAEADRLEAEAAAEAAAKAADKKEPDVAAFLRTELKDAQAELVKSAVAQSDLQRQIDSMKASHEALTEIAQASLANMRVALNLANAGTLTGDSLVAEHQAAAEAFKSKFKTGGVAAASQEEKTEDKPVAKLNPVFTARVNARSSK